MANRIGQACRETAEVEISVTLNLDESGPAEIALSVQNQETDITVALIKHFLAQVLRFGEIGGKIVGKGDFSHHLIEDVGICFGEALKKALGDKVGIDRSANHVMTMEGSLATAVLDLSGRSHLECDFEDVHDKHLFEMVKHLLKAISQHGELDLYCKVETVMSSSAIRNDHHMMEALGKAIGRTLRNAVKITGTGILSTKESL